MRTLLLIAILVISTNFAFAECTEYMQAFNKHQLVMKGLMDLNFQGKMNAEVADTIGKRLQEAQEPLDSGEYNKACEMYDSILEDYGFDKSFGEAPAPKKEESTHSSSNSSSDEASTTSDSAVTPSASSSADSEATNK